MRRRASKAASFVLLAVLAGTVAGCSSAPYIYQTYVGLGGRITRLDCQEAYEVFEKADKKLLMVRSSPGVEIARAVCGTEPAAARYRRAAQQHLGETNRPNCRVSQIKELTALHVEFSYDCAPVAASR